MIRGVPQGSVSGPLHFFDETGDACNYADDTTLHACDEDLATLVVRLLCAANRAVEWLKHNHMKLNPEKCHLLVSCHKHECILASIGGTSVTESYQEKLLGISIDRDLTFENHVKTLCKNAGRKLHALFR